MTTRIACLGYVWNGYFYRNVAEESFISWRSSRVASIICQDICGLDGDASRGFLAQPFTLVRVV